MIKRNTICRDFERMEYILERSVALLCNHDWSSLFYISKGESTVIDMNSPSSDSTEEFLCLFWVHHSEKLMNQI